MSVISSSRWIAIAAAVAGSLGLAGQAGAAPVTVSTDAGTTCTINAAATVGAGLLVKPVGFTGDISCTPAAPGGFVISNGGLVLDNSGTPLGLGRAGGKPNDPAAQETVLSPGFGNEPGGSSLRCESRPGTDCGFNGRQPLGLPGQSYTAIFGVALTAPEGENWLPVAGCAANGERAVACTSQATVTVR